MKKWLIAVLLVGVVVFGGIRTTKADEGWVISSFHSDIQLQQTGEIQVTEKIVANFGGIAKHGIFRDLPIRYQKQDGGWINTEINLKEVIQDDATAKYTAYQNGNFVELKIGDPNHTITGIHTYLLHYTVAGVITSFSNYDELYWNVTGNGWDVPISQASASFMLPKGNFQLTACYQGAEGSTQACTIAQAAATPQLAIFSTTRSLSSNEGLTVAGGFTKGIVPIEPVSSSKVTDIDGSEIGSSSTDLSINWTKTDTAGVIVLPLISFAVFFVLWFRRGRDEYYLRKSLNDPAVTVTTLPIAEHETIVAEYSPPANLRPAEIGTLIDERADTKDITASIVDLAVRGYLTITELPKSNWLGKSDYQLNKTNKDTQSLLGYERKLLANLFDVVGDGQQVKLSELKNKFATSLTAIKSDVYKELTDKGFFVGNPQKVRGVYYLIAVAIAVVGGITFSFGSYGVGIGFILGAVIAGLFGAHMSRRSALGRETLRQIKGYQLFVSATEKYRQPYFENHNIFMEVLPYAIVFGVTKKLAQAFKDMGIEPPQPGWYVGSTTFQAVAFASTIDQFSTSFSSAVASSPAGSGAGGGGFSGGGFGGGGGGGW